MANVVHCRCEGNEARMDGVGLTVAEAGDLCSAW